VQINSSSFIYSAVPSHWYRQSHRINESG
jgi:hypothetical protein